MPVFELSSNQDESFSTLNANPNSIIVVSSHSNVSSSDDQSSDNASPGNPEQGIKHPGTSQPILNPIKSNLKLNDISEDELSSLPNFHPSPNTQVTDKLNKFSFSTTKSENAYVKVSTAHNWSKFGIMFIFIIPMFLSFLIDDHFFWLFRSISLDCFLFLSPIIAFYSSEKVTRFTKLKIHQLKVRLGFI